MTLFAEGPFVLVNARLPDAAQGLAGGAVRAVDIRVGADGRVAAIEPAGARAPETGEALHDMRGGLVLPCLVDVHTHLDNGHIAPRAPNPDGTFAAALTAVSADRQARWTATDVARRMDFALSCAFAHGTAAIRTHIDSAPPQHEISWPLFAAARERWAGRVELQGVALLGPDHLLDAGLLDAVAATAKAHGGLLGGAVSVFEQAPAALRRVITATGRHGLALDLHIDESGDPASRSLRALADVLIETGFDRPVQAGHCCSLAIHDDAFAKETIARVARAGIAVASLPMCNLYLQDRDGAGGRTPRWRGVTLAKELAAAGVPVSFASDNTQDPFYRYGDLDGLEVFREAVRIAHLDHPATDAFGWLRALGATPARHAGFGYSGTVAAGQSADLILCSARSLGELLSRPQADRTVLRNGRAIARTLPDFRELDDL